MTDKATMPEEWRPMKGYEGYYEVSSWGRVKSLHRVIMRCNGSPQTVYEKILNFSVSSSGYYHSNLAKPPEKSKNILYHRAIAEAFLVPDSPEKNVVNHIDGNKLNNNIKNLEWCTAAYNLKHGIETGLIGKAVGEQKGRAKLTEKQVLEIRSRMDETNVALAKEYGVGKTTIRCIKTRTKWKHI